MKRLNRNRGVASILAMMFLVIFGALAAAMAIVAQGNLQTARTYQQVNRSLGAAEAGLHFANYRLGEISRTITTSAGEIDSDLADQIWIVLRDAIIDEMGDELHSLEPYEYDELTGRITLGRIPVSDADNAPTFQIVIERHPLAGEDYGSASYQRDPYNVSGGNNKFTADGEAVTSENPVTGHWIRVQSIGVDGDYRRGVEVDFRIDKKVRYAILSRNRVMIGRNVIIEGAIGSAYTMTDYQHGHPVQVRDNFHDLDPQLDDWLNALQTYLADNDMNSDNRVRLADSRESANLANAVSYDRNGDGFVDGYDMFLLRYDEDGSGGLSTDEFSDSGALVDDQLWRLINETKYPAGTQFDWVNDRVMLPGDTDWTDASADFASIDDSDEYAKIHGQLVLAAAVNDWENGAADGPYQEYLRGPISPDPQEAPLTFEADEEQLASFSPSDFDVSSYRDLATGTLADQTADPTANDPDSPAAYTPASAETIESVPYDSPYPYDHYERPIYENMVFTNVSIPRGTNAVFRNCKFIGVTFVDAAEDNDDENFSYAGMQDENGDNVYTNVSAVVDGEEVSDTKPLGNNLRFEDCEFEGMVATTTATAYSHTRNKLQFTGNTVFDLDSEELTAEEKAMFRKSTIMAPQFSIDIGTFTDPTNPNEMTTLDGTIVAGVLDIRGQARIDGSIITTHEPVPGEGTLRNGGNPANFNTTLGYFESSAGDAEAEVPTGGYGKIIIRYDPDRALPDGITGPIELRPTLATYAEGGG